MTGFERGDDLENPNAGAEFFGFGNSSPTSKMLCKYDTWY